MEPISSYKGKLLISKPVLYDDVFNRSVIYVVEDNDSGTIGFVLNHEIDENIHEFISTVQADSKVYEGGPVNLNNMYYFHSRPDLVSGSNFLYKNFYWSGDFQALQSGINTSLIKENEVKFFIGYSGWEKGQLKREIDENYWIVMKDESVDLLHDWNTDLWQRQLLKLGGENLLWLHTPSDPLLN